MTDLQQQLQAVLGKGVLIERELGGGGMSHVFLARDLTLGRSIVVKILPPELALGVNADRFKREVQLAAALQHPHIVPLLSAGEANGLPYFTMPFVEGESLRARLQRGEPLDTREAVGLLQDVAKALAYAHARGVVHRDIKPDNVLVSGGAAMVTDFGVAKALSSARDAGAGPEASMLTVVGTSLGTPAYMSPEQGAADPSTDHRADIYAFGCMAYELLTGAPPFGRRPLAATLVAHLTEPPKPILAHRPDLPPELGAIVMRCLAKDPAERPQSAAEVVRTLDEIPLSTGSMPASRRSVSAGRKRAVAVVMAAGMTIAVAGAGLLLVQRRPNLDAAALDRERVVVAPFENQTGDRSLDPVGKMAADWLTQGLAQTGLMKVVDASTAIRSDVSDGSGRASAQDIARSTGANQVVTGAYHRLGDSLRFQTRIVDARTNDVIMTMDDVVGPARDPTATLELLRQRLLGSMAVRYNPALRNWATQSRRPPTYDAYEAFVQAMQTQMRGGATADRRALLERAVSIDSTYSTAWIWLANAYANEGRRAKADSIIRRLRNQRAQLSPFEAALLNITDQMLHGTPESLLESGRALSAAAPGSEWRIVLVEFLLAANHPREALDSLLRISPDQGMLKGSPAHINMQLGAYHLLNDKQRMVAAAEQEMRLFPDFPSAVSDLALAHAVAGHWADVERLATEIQRRGRTPTFVPRNVLRSLASEVRWHGNPALAKAMLERVLASYAAEPDSLSVPSFKYGRALTLYYLERWKEAKQLFGELAAAPKASSEQKGFLALAAAHLGDRATAERLARAIGPEVPPPELRGVTIWRARIAAALGDDERAIELLRQAFAQGVPAAVVHADMDLEHLRGIAAFDQIVAPKG